MIHKPTAIIIIEHRCVTNVSCAPTTNMKSNVPGKRVRNLFVVVKVPVELMFLKGKTHNEPCVWAV